jgi:hypothetical protein
VNGTGIRFWWPGKRRFKPGAVVEVTFRLLTGSAKTIDFPSADTPPFTLVTVKEGDIGVVVGVEAARAVSGFTCLGRTARSLQVRLRTILLSGTSRGATSAQRSRPVSSLAS